MKKIRPARSAQYQDSREGLTLITFQEGAERADVTVRTLHNWANEGRLTKYRIGPRLVRIDLNELLSLAIPVNREGVA